MKRLLFVLTVLTSLSAQDRSLPEPNKSEGLPFYNALAQRSTVRDFDNSRDISDEILSQLLWSGLGINREESGKRTAPSAWGNNEIDLYVLSEAGTYKYIPESHSLTLIVEGDNRDAAGIQDFAKAAPLSFILVGDLSKITQIEDVAAKTNLAYIDAGYVSQNLYLAATSEGIATGARGMIDKAALTELLQLNENQIPIIGHSFGYQK